MKSKALTLTLAIAMAAQITATAAEHKHDWIDDIKNSDETTNRYYCECGATKDEDIASIRNFIVAFGANGGYVDVTKKETNGEKIRRLPIPEHTSDYQWEGWYTQPQGGELVDENYIYEEDTTLYAQWTVQGTRILTFASDGGSYIRPITKTYGETIDLTPYIPQKQVYIFKGWYTDPRTKQNQVTSFTFHENGVLYAKWEADETQIQPDTLMTTDPIYLTEEQLAERMQRIWQILAKFAEMTRKYK